MLRQKSRRYDGYGSYAPLKNATSLLQLLLQILLLHISLNYHVITSLRHYVITFQTRFTVSFSFLKFNPVPVPVPFQFSSLKHCISIDHSHNSCNCLMLIKYWNSRDREFEPTLRTLSLFSQEKSLEISGNYGKLPLITENFGTLSSKFPDNIGQSFSPPLTVWSGAIRSGWRNPA